MRKEELSSIKNIDIWSKIKELRRNDICDLAPKFREKIIKLMEECSKIEPMNVSGIIFQFDLIVFETSRSNELQQIYYSQRTTNARHAFYSWHFYGLAIDIISKSRNWNVPLKWWDKLGEIVRSNNLRWGGDFRKIKDYAHIQWKDMVDSPIKLHIFILILKRL